MDLVKKGSTDRSVTIRIIDSTDGTPETGVVFNTSGIDLWYRREGAAKVSITEATLAALTTAHTDGGFLHISDGSYRLDLPDAAFATGANHVDIGGTVTGMVVIGGRVRLVDYDPEDAVRAGLTALPNAAADAAGGLPISDAGGLDLDTLNSNVSAILVDTGTTLDGKLDTIDDFLDTEVAAILAAVDTEVASIISTLGTAGDGLTAINLPDQSMNITGNITGNLSGSVGSVTGGINTSGTITTLDALDTAQDLQHAATQATLNGLVLVEGTIGSTGNDTTHLHLDGLTYGDDEINNYLLVIFDNSASEYHARWVEDWVLSTELATVATLPFTPEDGVDTYWLLPTRQDVTGGSGLDATGVRAAIGLASANLDTQLSGLDGKLDTIDDFLDTEVAAILAAVDTEIASIVTTLGTAGDGLTEAGGTGDHLTAIPWNAAWDAEVQSEATDALNAYDPPTNAEMEARTLLAAAYATAANQTTMDGKLDTIDNFLDTEMAAILAAVDTEIAAILVDTGTDIPATLSSLLATAMTEGYRSTGATGSVRDLLYEILANIVEFSNAGTTRTAKKLDGSTTAKTYTYDDADNPTSITETT